MNTEKNYRHLVTITVAGLFFLLIVLSPGPRLVSIDGFTTCVQGQLLARGQLGGSHAQIDDVARSLDPVASQRRETLPMPKGFPAKEQIEKINVETIKLHPGRDHCFYLPQSWNGRALYAVAHAVGFPSIVTVLIILPLIILAAWCLGPRGPNGTSQWHLTAILIMFNPLVLFYTFQGPTGDCFHGLLLSLCLIAMGKKDDSVSRQLVNHHGKALVAVKKWFRIALIGIGFALVIVADPDMLPLIITLYLSRLIISTKRKRSDLLTLLAIFMCSVTIISIMMFIGWRFFGNPWTLAGGQHNSFFNTSFFHAGHDSSDATPLYALLFRNCYLVFRTCLLALPVLLPALLAMAVDHGQNRTAGINYLSFFVLVLATLPTLFAARPEFAHYLLTGKNLIVAVPFMTGTAVSWLSTRSKTEQRTWSAVLVLIGIAGYAFFLARMRLDFLSLGLMEALDKNYTRMYLVYQYGELFL